jgi:hypothetical protein
VPGLYAAGECACATEAETAAGHHTDHGYLASDGDGASFIRRPVPLVTRRTCASATGTGPASGPQ